MLIVCSLYVTDCVEFNLSYDYRSSRWLAVSVSKKESILTVSKEQFSGVVVVKAEPQEKYKVCTLVLYQCVYINVL